MRASVIKVYQLVSQVPLPDNSSFDTLFRLVDSDTVYGKKSSGVVYKVGGSNDFNNPYDFYVDGNVAVGGDGSIEKPFKTLTELNNKVLSFPANVDQYIGYLAPYTAGYGNEVYGSLLIAENLNLRGQVANMTVVNCRINLTSSGLGSGATILSYKGIAFNSAIQIDLTNSLFGYISLTDGQALINRIDANTSATVILNGGIGASSILGGLVTIINSLIFGTIDVSTDAEVSVLGTTILVPKTDTAFNLNGNAVLKTLSMLNPRSGYVTGIPVGLDVPEWETDAASNDAYLGTLTRTIF